MVAAPRALTIVAGRYELECERVFDFGVDEEGPYYTMELLDGADLKARCPMPRQEVCKHLRDETSSLALLHSRRLAHGDVSVTNVRLTSEGRAKKVPAPALRPATARAARHGSSSSEREHLQAQHVSDMARGHEKPDLGDLDGAARSR